MMARPYFGQKLSLVTDAGTLNVRDVIQRHPGDTPEKAKAAVIEELQMLKQGWHHLFYDANLRIIEGTLRA